MNSIKMYLNSLGRGVRTTILALAVIFVSAGIAQAATTISTNISTDGTLGVTGVSTMTNASTTQSATVGGPLWIGGNATTTAAGALTINGAFSGTSGTFSTTLGVTGLTSIAGASTTGSVTIGTGGSLWVGGNATTTSAGALTINGAFSGTSGTFSTTLGVTGLTSIAGASTTGSVTIGTGGSLWVGGNATTTSAGALSLQSTLKVGSSGNAVSNVVAGYCVIPATTFAANTSIETGSTTPVYADCTPYTSAGTAITSLTAGTGSGASRVFVQATSSLPAYLRLQAASTTATNIINVRLVNVSTSTAVTSAIYAFNFWSFQ